jgi:hypothetical protein
MGFPFGILIKVNTSKGIGKPQFPKNSAQKSIHKPIVWPVPLAKVLPRPQLIFPSKNLVFWEFI